MNYKKFMINNHNNLVFITVNKNGFMSIWNDEPVKNESTGKWEGKFLYANSELYKEFKKLIKESNINWINEPIVLDITI